MFKKEPVIFLSALGLVGYVTFHGHRVQQDCWMCSYRGLAFMLSSVALGGYLAVSETD
jgi:hypothetical protein